MPRNITPPTADDVRAWGRNKGFTVADRGRLSHELIDAFNKGRKNVFVQTHAPVPQGIVVTVGQTTTKGGKVKAVTEVTTAAPIRAWAREAGIDLGNRGRIPASVVAAYEAAMLSASEKAAKREAAKAKAAATRAAKKAAAAAELVNA